MPGSQPSPVPIALDSGAEAGHLYPSTLFSVLDIAPMLFNCFSLKRGDAYHIQQRPTFTSAGLSVSASGSSRGIWYWPIRGAIYYVQGATFVEYVLATGVSTNLTTSSDTTSRFVGFAELNTGSANYLIMLDGVKGWYVNSAGTATQITDGDFPTPHIPTPVCFDGYLFVAKASSQDIYNSSPADVTNWQASTFIRSEQYSGYLTAIALHKNQLVAFHSDGIAFFRDAGIPSPNSPLQRVIELSEQVGLARAANMTVHSDSELYFLGTGFKDTGGMYTIKDSKLQRLENPIFDQLVTTYAEFTSFGTNRKLLSLRYFGQTFLIWERIDPNSLNNSTVTFVLNAKSGQLSFWGSRLAGSSAGTAAYDPTGVLPPRPLGLIDIVRVGDLLYGWNQDIYNADATASPLVTMIPNTFTVSNTVWNTADHDGNTSVSADARTLTRTLDNTKTGGRATNYKSAGKWYFEMVSTFNNNSIESFGLATSACVLTGDVNAANAYTYRGSGATFASGTPGTSGNSVATGDVMQCCVDFDLGKIWFGASNTFVSTPGSGAAMISFTPATSMTIVALANNSGSAPPALTWVLRTITSQCTYTPPTGFTVWDGY